jgi:hypothetical protein
MAGRDASLGRIACERSPSFDELLGQNALIQAMACIEEHGHGDGAIFRHINTGNISHLEIISDGAHRTLICL